VHGVPIRNPKFGHLDTAIADLAGRGWLAYRAAFAQPDLRSPAWQPILRDRPVIEVTDAEADALACNVAVVGDAVIGGLTPRLCRSVERLGLTAVPVDLDEFRKAGGGAHCLTLELHPIHLRAARPDDRAVTAASTT
jgi:N-dimethylarginine dimethylaminohydrolase